jgi:hypothetical protein
VIAVGLFRISEEIARPQVLHSFIDARVVTMLGDKICEFLSPSASLFFPGVPQAVTHRRL